MPQWVLLACMVLFRLLGSITPAVLGGLVMGVNPALNSSVVWISGRNYLLAMVFLLLSFYALLRGRPQAASHKLQATKSREGVWRLLFAGSFLLALLAHGGQHCLPADCSGWILGNQGTVHNGTVPGFPEIWGLSPVFPLSAAVLPVVAYLGLRLGVARVPFVPGALSDVISQPLVGLNAFGQEMLVVRTFVQRVFTRRSPVSQAMPCSESWFWSA